MSKSEYDDDKDADIFIPMDASIIIICATCHPYRDVRRMLIVQCICTREANVFGLLKVTYRKVRKMVHSKSDTFCLHFPHLLSLPHFLLPFFQYILF